MTIRMFKNEIYCMSLSNDYLVIEKDSHKQPYNVSCKSAEATITISYLMLFILIFSITNKIIFKSSYYSLSDMQNNAS